MMFPYTNPENATTCGTPPPGLKVLRLRVGASKIHLAGGQILSQPAEGFPLWDQINSWACAGYDGCDFISPESPATEATNEVLARKRIQNHFCCKVIHLKCGLHPSYQAKVKHIVNHQLVPFSHLSNSLRLWCQTLKLPRARENAKSYVPGWWRKPPTDENDEERITYNHSNHAYWPSSIKNEAEHGRKTLVF